MVGILIVGKKVYSANVGDSRAILASQNRETLKFTVKPLSIDHKPELPKEKKRIESFGGRVQALLDENYNECGPNRVWLKNEDIPGLAMSRSIGDIVASKVGVISEPGKII